MHFIRYLLVSWLFNAFVLGLVALVFDDVRSDSFGDLLLAAAVFGVLNTLVKPLLRLLTLPIAIVTLGLAWFFVSMLMLWLTSEIVSGFDISGFWTFVGATVAVWVVNVVVELAARWWRRGRRSGASTATS
jgi:putative membrane protein